MGNQGMKQTLRLMLHLLNEAGRDYDSYPNFLFLPPYGNSMRSTCGTGQYTSIPFSLCFPKQLLDYEISNERSVLEESMAKLSDTAIIFSIYEESTSAFEKANKKIYFVCKKSK